MSLTALALLLVAALLHAGWNLLVKRAQEKQLFTWWALLAGTIIFLPALWLSPLPGAQVWPYVAASGAVEAAYFVILTYSYQLGDFSLVYPLARGAAPALLALWAALFLGERFTPGGLAGLALLLAGLLLVGGASSIRRLRLDVRAIPQGVPAALAVATCVSIYSAIDGAAMRLTPAPAYTVLVLGLSAVLTAPAVLARYGSRRLLAEWRANWPRMILVGFLMTFVFILVLEAYSRARVSYAGAIREVSVVFAALAGWRLLGESFGAVRSAGAVLIFLGILIIASVG